MDYSLRLIAAALAKLSDAELRALTMGATTTPPALPGLLVWLDHLSDWEQHRRRGKYFALQPPEAAIDPRDDAAGIAAALMLRRQFEQEAPNVATLFAAIARVLSDGAGRH